MEASMEALKIGHLCMALKGIGVSIGKIRDGIGADDVGDTQRWLKNVQDWTQEVESAMRRLDLDMVIPGGDQANIIIKCPIVHAGTGCGKIPLPPGEWPYERPL